MSYWDNVHEVYLKQRMKGISEYGQPLEENYKLTDPVEIIREAEEELVDALMYCEHAVKNIKRDDDLDELLKKFGEEPVQVLKGDSTPDEMFEGDCVVSDIVQDAVINALKEIIPVIVESVGKLVLDND